MDFKLHYVGSKVIEQGDFKITRPEGSPRFIFFHFNSTVSFTINGEKIDGIPGCCILYEPGVQQEFESNSMRINHDYLDFECFDSRIFKELRIPLNEIITTPISDEITKTIADIYDYSKGDYVLDVIVEKKLLDLFITLSDAIHKRHSNLNTNYSESLRSLFEKLRHDLYQNPQGLTATALAKKLGFTPSYFNVLYKKFFFTTPLKDLDKARLEMVKKMLLSGEKTYEIVRLLGFSNEEYFYYWFKRNTNMTIRKFIESKKKEG